MAEAKKVLPASPLHIFGLTAAFFSSGALFLAAALGLGIWLLPRLAAGQELHSASGIVLAHLLLLGWATSVAMGASFQLTQVIFKTTLFSRALGFVQFGFYAPGLAILVGSFYYWYTPGIAAGGIMVAAGIVAYVVNLTVSYIRSGQRSPIMAGSCCSLLDLLLTAGLGVTMGIAAAGGGTPARYTDLFALHMWFGVAGWLAGLILSYSFKLLPMFYVSKKKPGRDAYAIIFGYQAGIWLTAAGWWLHVRPLGILGEVMITATLGWFVLFAFAVRRESSGKSPIGAVRVALWQAPAVFAVSIVWTWAAITGHTVLPSYKLASTMLLLLISGWFTATIFSFLSRIIPFLWWAFRFRTKEEKKNAVLLSDMTHGGRLTAELTVYLGGVCLTAAGNWFASGSLAAAGEIVAAAAALIYMVELGRVLRF